MISEFIKLSGNKKDWNCFHKQKLHSISDIIIFEATHIFFGEMSARKNHKYSGFICGIWTR